MSTHYDDDTLLRYRYDTLATDESNAVAAHLRTCTECASRFAELGRGLELLGSYDAEAELDEGLAERVMERVREQQREQEAAQARQEAEAARRSAEEARREAEAARDAALRLLEEPGPASTTPAPADRPAPDADKDRRLDFWAFLGLKAGGSLRAVRLVATLATVAGAVYVAGGSLYYSGKEVTIDTRVSGEDDLIPGSRGMLLVRVLNRLTRQPVAHADVRVALRGPMGKPSEQAWKLFAGKTDQRGLADPAFDLPDVADGTYQLEVTASGAGETDRVVYPLRFHRAYKVHLSTDKPLYQPGQTIHIRTLVLRRPTLTPAEDRKVAIEVIDPKNNRLMREEVQVSKFGVGAYSLELADDLRLGPYRIRASVDGAQSEMQVQVARYTLPKFKITVRPDKPFFLAGETLRADVEARYFFGKAVERGEVRVVLFKPDGSALGDEIKGRTGRDGKWVLTAELPASLAAPGHPETVMMEVAVKDAAGQEERKQQGVTVSRDLLQIEVLPEGGRLVAEMENTLFVLTTSPDGQPLPSRVTVTLPDGKTVPVRTHANGLGAFRFTPSKAQLARPSYPGRHVIESRVRSVEYSVRDCFRRHNAQGQATARLVIGAAGRLVSTELSGPLAGTPAGQCVEAALGAASFPAFSGPPITVQVGYELTQAGVGARDRLTRQEIQDAMAFVQPAVERCYSRYRVPGLANVKLTIAPNGRITRAEVRGTFAGSPTGRCVERAVRRVAFPAFTGAPTTIAYPFVLREPLPRPPGPRIRRPARRRPPPRPQWHAGPVQWISPAGGPEHGLGTTLQLRGEDDQGRKGSRSVTLPGVLEKVLVATDQAFYLPGDTAQVGIQTITQFTSAVVEGLQEGQTMFRTRVPLKEGRGTAAVDLPAGLTGTVRLDVQALDPYDVRSPVVSRKIVVAEQQGLTVKMTADRPSFRPGSQAKLRFKVTGPDGSPKAAAIGLTVVDESVFALAASRPALARAFFLLERSLMETKHNLSVAEAVSREPWGEAEQQAGRLLLSLDRDTVRPRRFVTETFETKVAGLQASRTQFEDNAVMVAVAVGLVLLLVLVVAAARRLPPWAGGILLALAGGIALLIPVDITWVLLALAVGVVVALAVHGQQSGRFGWAFLLIPAVGVLAVWLLTAKSADRAPDTVSVTAVSEPTGTTVEAPRAEEGKMGSRPRPGPAGRAGAFGLREQEEAGDLKAALEPGTGAAARPRRKARDNLDDLVDGAIGGAKKGKAEARTEAAARAIPRRQVRVRRYFPETMYVHPELVTDEKGVAELALPMADSITEWRVSALASSADGKVGALDRPLKVFQDFFVDLDMPVALVRGDEATIPVAVYNYLSVPQTVRLEVKPEGWFEVLGPTRLAVQLEPGGVDGVEIRIRVVQAGRHRLSLRADGTKLSDALARELLVSEAGQERSDSASGTLRPGEVVRVTVQVPDAAVRGTARLMAKLFPSRLASALDGLENALRMPHGCFEQTSSATYPNVLIYDYLKRAGKLTPQFEQRAKRFIGLGYQRLLRFEVAGGGFEWFGRPPANKVLTAYGLMEFSDMSRVFAVDENLIRRTQRWLVSRQNGDGSWSPDARSLSDGLWRSGFNGQLMVTAYIAWALAESGYRGTAVRRALDYLSNNLTSINDAYTLSLVAAAFARAKFGDKARLELATTGLQRLATRQDKLTYFRPAEATVYYGRGTAGNVETTALAAYALGLLGRAPETVEGALSYLAANRDYRGTWHSTQGTILALRALLAGAGTDANQRVTVRINGQDAGTHALDAAADRPVLVDLGNRARPGVNVVELSGEARATFQVVATYTLPWREKDADEDRPLALKVSYDRTRVTVGGIVPVEVQLTYRKPEPSGMVLLALGLPAGLAPLPEDLQALVSSGKVARYELAQSRVNLYIDRLATGATETYQLRLKARSKVRTQGVGSLAYLYYHPEIRAAAPPSNVTIN